MTQHKPAPISAPAAVASTLASDQTAIRDPEHLKAWLLATHRDFVIFQACDLVDALEWPTQVTALSAIISAYRQHRNGQAAETVPCPRKHGAGTGAGTSKDVCTLCHNHGIVVTRGKDETLELDEMKEAVSWLLAKIHAKDPTFTP